jgi:chromosomal replication initiation ATPase DnaA
MNAAMLEIALRSAGLSVTRRPATAEDLLRLATGTLPTVEQVIAAAAHRLGVSERDLVGRRRSRRIVVKRMIAMAAARAAAGASTPEIGRAFGRDPSTVLHALGRVEGWLDAGGDLGADVRAAIDGIAARARDMAKGIA